MTKKDEKLNESITFKCTYEEKRTFEAIARAEKIDVSKLSRICMNEKIQFVKDYLHSLRELERLTTETIDTFELVSPLRDVSPSKTTGIKKAQLSDQLSFSATPMNLN